VLTAHSFGSVLDQDHPVYAIKAVHAIPLTEDRATVAMNALLSRNTRNHRPSLLPPIDDDDDDVPEDSLTQSAVPTRAVKFADGDVIKVMTPIAARKDVFAGLRNDRTYSASSSSGRTSPSSEISQTEPVERTIASRLAFWNVFSKKSILHDFSNSYPVDDPDISLDTIITGGYQEAAEVLRDIIATTAPAPTTQEETHHQLEAKIVRETIKEFTKGGMYFAYSFGQCSVFLSQAL
jgi:hypothetical protein